MTSLVNTLTESNIIIHLPLLIINRDGGLWKPGPSLLNSNRGRGSLPNKMLAFVNDSIISMNMKKKGHS